MNSTFVHSLNWLGSFLAIIGVGYVCFLLHSYYTQIDVSHFGISDWLVVLGFALLYGCANFLLAFAWRSLLDKFGGKTSWMRSVKIYGVSQLAKYLPGNIFHLAGRQAMGVAAGIPGWTVAKSAIWELGLISFAGTLVSLTALPLVFPMIATPLAVGIFTVATGLVGWGLCWFSGPSSAWALSSYLGFLSTSGMVFAGLVGLVSGDSLPWFSLLGAFTIAWLAGLVTPGAPAGVGVRELVLLFLLKDVVVETDLLLVIVLGRLVTLFGDISFFAVAALIDAGDKSNDLG